MGKTTNIKRRLSSHIYEAKSNKGKRYVLNWINSLLSRKLKPLIKLIEECREDNWQIREIYWIKYYRSISNNLCNISDGGLGGSGSKNWSEDELKERSERMSKQFSKFSKKECRHIWDNIQKGLSWKEIKIMYPQYSRNIHFQVKTGRTWNSITGLDKLRKIRESISWKLTNDDIINIRNMYDNKEKTQKELSDMYNVSTGYISDICKRKKR